MDEDVLSGVLSSIRLSGSLQFCFMPAGDWQTDDKPAFNQGESSAGVMPFHIMVEGTCWLKLPDRHVDLAAGDIVAFPFGTGHQLGYGSGGRMINPTTLLPPKPWREIPILHYGEGPAPLRLLCGYLHCDAMDFRPLRKALPTLLHMKTEGSSEAHWLRATIAQIVAEVDRPHQRSDHRRDRPRCRLRHRGRVQPRLFPRLWCSTGGMAAEGQEQQSMSIAIAVESPLQGSARVNGMHRHDTMQVMPSLLLPPQDRLAALCRRWKIRELSMFGSVARGDARVDSDIDLLVEYEPDADWSLLDTARLRRELSELFDRPVDLVRERNITNPYRLASIRRNRRELYAA